MYMDENDVRTPRDRVDGELLRRLLGENGSVAVAQTPHGDMSGRNASRGCHGNHTGGNNGRGIERRTLSGNAPVGDRRGGMFARNENGPADKVENNSCGCGCDCGCDMPTCDTENNTIGNTYPCKENGVEGRSLAMVYAPLQPFCHMYDPQTALSRGTMFRELDMPFRGDGISARGGNCRGC